MKKDKLVLVIIILLLVSSFVLITVGESYSFFTYTKKGTTKNKISTGILGKSVLADAILRNNQLITSTPNFTNDSSTCDSNTSSSSSSSSTTCIEEKAGLYVSKNTNDNSPTYYFRGNVKNNYVSFAGKIWRIIRINEDSTVRMVSEDGLDSDFDSSHSYYTDIYYTYSDAKTTLNNWYSTNIAIDDKYSSKVATGDYFCEQAKVKYNSEYVAGSANMTIYTSYIPNFKCSSDGNGRGIVNSNIGLITYDEAIHAGAKVGSISNPCYLNKGGSHSYTTMSPAGDYFNAGGIIILHRVWYMEEGMLTNSPGYSFLHPVINLKADVKVTGTGLESDMYIVE